MILSCSGLSLTTSSDEAGLCSETSMILFGLRASSLVRETLLGQRCSFFEVSTVLSKRSGSQAR